MTKSKQHPEGLILPRWAIAKSLDHRSLAPVVTSVAKHVLGCSATERFPGECVPDCHGLDS